MACLRLGERTLYLYSTGDPWCDPAVLEAHIAARRAAGHAVQAGRPGSGFPRFLLRMLLTLLPGYSIAQLVRAARPTAAK